MNNVKRLLETNANIGDFLCNKCRVNLFKKMSEDKENELSQEVGPSHGRKSQDPTYTVANKAAETSSIEFIDIGFPRVVSTHKYCFLCRSSE